MDPSFVFKAIVIHFSDPSFTDMSRSLTTAEGTFSAFEDLCH